MSSCAPISAQLPTFVPTRHSTATLAPLVSPMPTATAGTIGVLMPTASYTPTLVPTATLTASPTVTLVASATATPLPAQFSFGKSAGGRDLLAYRIGTGATVLMLVGGVHMGYEANTARLLNEVITHYQAVGVSDGMSLLIIPTLNADGVGRDGQLAGRFNGNGVDLNRNWGCGWAEEAYFREGRVNAGSAPFSEPETQALGALIQQLRPQAVLFYHAAARGVFAGDCGGGGVSQALAQAYSEASGYPYGEAFTAYPVSGTAPSWVDSLGIASADVELASTDSTEFTRNLRAIERLLGRGN